MSEFLKKGGGLFHFLLGAPASEQQQAILLAVGLFSGLFIFSRMSAAVNVSHTGAGLTLLVYVLGITLLYAGILFLDDYVMGKWLSLGRMTGVIVSTVIVSLVFVVPLICVLQKCRYTAGAYTWFVALCAMVFTMVIAQTGLEMVESGGKNATKVQKRTAEVQEFIQGSR